MHKKNGKECKKWPKKTIKQLERKLPKDFSFDIEEKDEENQVSLFDQLVNRNYRCFLASCKLSNEIKKIKIFMLNIKPEKDPNSNLFVINTDQDLTITEKIMF
jgi:hypothetical protein